MAFDGTLVAVGANNTPIPYKYIKAETYKATPNQRLEVSAKRVSTGVLHRTTVAHTATKIEWETHPMWNKDVNALMTLLRSNMTNVQERKINVRYYDPETDTHKTATCYMPDIDFPILKVDAVNRRILYDSIRICFIEY